MGLPRSYLSSLGAIVDGLALVAQHIQQSFAPPFRLPMETKVRLLGTAGATIALAGHRSLAADGDVRTTCDDARGAFRLIYLAAFEAPDETALLNLLARESRLAEWLREQHSAGAVIAAAGAAVFALAEAKLLEHGAACVPREFSALFRHRHPRVRLETRAAVAEHDNVFSTGSLATEWTMVTQLVERVMSTHSARWLATRTGLQRTRDTSRAVSEDALVAAAQYWLGERFARPFKIRELARALSVSHSTLIRHFESALSTTPQRYAKMLRAESAKGMLANTRRSVGQISVMVGYADMRSFRAAFREYAGMSPSQYRHRIVGGAKIGE